MANIGKWNAPGAVQTPHSTSLNTLGSGSMSAASSTITNGSNLDIYVDLEIVLAAWTPTAGGFIAIYIGEAIDGSNFPAQSAADMRLSTTQLLCSIPVGTSGSAQRTVVRNVVIPPGSFQLYVDNQTGGALAASGNTLRYIAYDLNLNG